MSRPVPPPPDVISRVRALVERTSISQAARTLGFADATVARLAGGLPVSVGTALVAAQRLQETQCGGGQ